MLEESTGAWMEAFKPVDVELAPINFLATKRVPNTKQIPNNHTTCH